MGENGNLSTPPSASPLADALEALLAPLGGQTAVAARRLPLHTKPILVKAASDPESQPATAHTNPSGEGRVSLRADLVFPAASLAKLPIAIELLRRADLGQFDLAERFETASEPRVSGDGILDALDPATQLTLADLCTLMLAVSDNTAANFLLDLVGMGEVNETLSRLNLRQTHLARRFMDFEARAARRENTTSAADMLTLLGLLQSNAVPGARRIRDMLTAQQKFEEVRAYLPDDARIAFKSGTLEGVVHNAGLLTGPGGACAYCVLTSDQRDVPAARSAVCAAIRLLWDAWCAR